MKFQLIHGLPFVDLVVEHGGQQLTVNNVHRIAGVGGYEYVIQKTVDHIYFNDVAVDSHSIQLGDLDYGFGIQGIIGSDILNKIGAIVDFSAKTISLKE